VDPKPALGSPANTRTPRRVLIVADNVSLRMSGETAVPYYYFTRFRERQVDAWLVCHARVRDELRETLSADALTKVLFVEDDAVLAAVWKVGTLFPYRVEDLIFGQAISMLTQLKARRLVQRLVQEKQIEVVFQPIPITPRGVSFMYDVGAPTVIGPLCGGLDLPPAFRYMESRFTRASVHMGRYVSWFGHRVFPGKLHAEALLVGNARTARVLPSGYRGKVIEVVESGVDLARWPPKDHCRAPGGPVRFVFCGRFVDWKGAQFLVEAFARVPREIDARLEMIGDGELLDSSISRATELGIADRVVFHGRLPLERCMQVITDSDVYMMPSLRECGGLALLEAMAIGLPVVAANWAGPAEYLTPECGVLVAPDSPDALVAGLATAMSDLARSPERRRMMGAAAQRRVAQSYFDWDRKTDRVLEILGEISQASATSGSGQSLQ